MSEIKTAIFMGDFHINSTVALIKPNMRVEDTTYHANYTQRWLWNCFIDSCQKIVEFPGKKILFLNGDTPEIDEKQRSFQLHSRNPADIASIVYETLEPLLDVVDQVYVIRGTEAHTGKSGWMEELLARDLIHSVKFDKDSGKEGEVNNKKYASWRNVRISVSGVKIDICHHASMGRLPWTAPNAANKIASMGIFDYTEKLHAPTPHLFVRSHNHVWSDSFDNYSTTRAVCLASWTTATEYVYRIGMENRIADIGFAYAICDNGKYELYKEKYPHKEAQRVWKLTA